MLYFYNLRISYRTMQNAPTEMPRHERPSGPMSNIGKNAAVAARSREEKFRASLYGLPQHPNRGSKGLNVSTGTTYETSANGQKFKYQGKNLVEGKEWLGEQSKNENRIIPWQGTYNNKGNYRVTKGGKTRRNKKLRNTRKRR